MPKLWRKKRKTFRAAIETSFTLVAAIGQASPDPVVGTVLTFIVKVKEEVDKVVAYKDSCNELLEKCGQWLKVYHDNHATLERTALKQYMDEFKKLLEEIVTHLERHNAKKSIAIWFHLRRLSKHLQRWSGSLDTQIQKFGYILPMENHKKLNEHGVKQEAALAATLGTGAAIRDLQFSMLHGRAPTDEEYRDTDNARYPEDELPIPQEVVQEVSAYAGPRDTIRMSGFWRKERWAVKLLYCTIPINTRAAYIDSVVPKKPIEENSGNATNDHSDSETKPKDSGDYPQDGADIVNEDTLDVGLFKKLLLEEIKTWEGRDHPNLLKIYGVSTTLNKPLYGLHVVYRWMESPIDEWCDKHPESNPLRLLAEAAAGLNYMHSFGAAHGNLRCCNIQVNQEGHAMIHDFEVVKVIRALDVKQAADTQLQVTAACCRWMSPEFLNKYNPVICDGRHTDPDMPLPTLQSDVWSFGMTMVELSTKFRPLTLLRVYFHVMNVIRDPKGERPQRPLQALCPWMSDGVWKIVQDCLCEVPEDRPTMNEVEKRLRVTADAYDAVPVEQRETLMF